MQCFRVDGLFQVFDENVAIAALALGRVTMALHDADGLAVDEAVVERVQGAGGSVGVELHIVVDIGIA